MQKIFLLVKIQYMVDTNYNIYSNNENLIMR